MLRLLAAVCCLVAAGILPAAAQNPAPPTAGATNITAGQARAVLDILNDPAKRAAFAATLNAIINAAPPTTAAPNAPVPPPANAAAAHADADKPAPPAASAPQAADNSPAPAAPNPAAGTPPKPAEAKAAEELKIHLTPNSLGAQVLLSASEFLGQLAAQTVQALQTVQSLPLLYGWAFVMVTNPVAHELLIDIAWRLGLAVACAAAAQYLLTRAMRRPIRSLEAIAPRQRAAEAEETPPPPGEAEGVARAEAGEVEPPDDRRPHPSTWILLRRVPLVIARLILELVPVLAIAAVGHLLAGSNIGGHRASRLIILAVIDSYAVCAAVLCLARMLLSPGTSRLRLFHLRDSTADYLMRWIHRLALISVFGYASGEIGLLLGLSDMAHDLFEKAVGFVLHVCLAIIVLQKRRAVRRVLRAPEGQTGFTAALRNRLAAVWHWIALFVLAAVWLVWAIEVPHGFALMLHYCIVTGLLLIGVRFTLLLLLGVVDRLMRPAPGKTTVSPAIDTRLRIYHPLVSAAIRMTIYVLCVLGLAQLYGMNAFLWLFDSPVGLHILSGVGTIVVTLVLAFGVWEAVNAYVHSHLDRLQREAQMARSARLRTLLPLLRSVLLISIAIVAGLMVLSEIGINIAPLLAGAGIAGVAIGFGSQKLVQDLITGIFLLLENAMQVGDSVTVSGLSGTVEALSVRTIRLRAADGSVHLIPFSSVTSVTNVNRGLGNASVNVVVDYAEDTDRVSAELKAIVEGMRSDPSLSAMMLSDLQLWGVDKVDGAGVVLAGQVVCTDAGRWPVQREFNRRMKRRFQELGIRVFNPVQTVSVTATFRPDPRTTAGGSAGQGADQRALSDEHAGSREEGKDDGHAQAAD